MKGQENSRYQDQPTARVRGPRTQGRDELRRAAETTFAAHKRLRHRRPEAHPPKVREGQQGDHTCKLSRHHRNWSTLTQGAKPQQASRAGEAQKKKGRAEAQPKPPGKLKDRQLVTGKKTQGSLQQGRLRKLQALRKRMAHGEKTK